MDFPRPDASPGWSSSLGDPNSPWATRFNTAPSPPLWSPSASPAPSSSTVFHAPMSPAATAKTREEERDEFSDSEFSDVSSMRSAAKTNLAAEEVPLKKKTDSSPPTPLSLKLKKTSENSWLSSSSSSAATDDSCSGSGFSGVKVKLKRDQAFKWNVDRESAAGGGDEAADVSAGGSKQNQSQNRKNIDNVVLNLKRTAGNVWDIAEAASQDASAPATPGSSKKAEKRRGRKSKVAPVKKIQVPAEKAKKATKDDGEELVLPHPGKQYSIDGATKDEAVRDDQSKSLPSNEKTATPEKEAHKEVSREDPSPTFKSRVVKTFTRKPKKAPLTEGDATAPPFQPGPSANLESLSNQLSLSTGLPGLQISIGGAGLQPPNISTPKPAVPKVTTEHMYHELNRLNVPFEEKPEFRSMLKAVVGKGNEHEDQEFMGRLQRALGIQSATSSKKDDFGRSPLQQQRVVLHVGEGGRSTIDLPKPEESMDVSVRGDESVEILLSGESDGIEGEVLRAGQGPKRNVVFVRKRGGGRPKKQVPGQAAPSPGPPQLPLPPDLPSSSGGQPQQRQNQQQLPYRFCPPPGQGTLARPQVGSLQVQPPPPQPTLNLPQPNRQHQHQLPSAQSFCKDPVRQQQIHTFFSKAENIEMFRSKINSMMDGYVYPQQLASRGIDPVIAMLASRLADPNENREQLFFLMEAYATMLNYETWMQHRQQQLAMQQQQKQQLAVQRQLQLQAMQQQQQQQQQLAAHQQQLQQQAGQQQQAMQHQQLHAHQAGHPRHSVGQEDRTYTELQTVRGKGSATDVIRHHQEQQQEQRQIQRPSPPPQHQQQQGDQEDKEVEEEEEQSESASKDDGGATAAPSKETPTPSPAAASSAGGPPSNRPAAIKQEVMEYPSTPVDPGSVQLTSVVPGAPSSVMEMREGMPASGAKAGSGNMTIFLHYQSSSIGPILVNTEEEVRLVHALLREKIAEMGTRGRSLDQKQTYFTEARKARSLLQPDVVAYLDRVFTKKGLAECVVGRKKKNYPKRKDVIKIDPVTKLPIPPRRVPEGRARRAAQEMLVKKEPVEEEEEEEEEEEVDEPGEAVQPLSEGREGRLSRVQASLKKGRLVPTDDINKILSNTDIIEPIDANKAVRVEGIGDDASSSPEDESDWSKAKVRSPEKRPLSDSVNKVSEESAGALKISPKLFGPRRALVAKQVQSHSSSSRTASGPSTTETPALQQQPQQLQLLQQPQQLQPPQQPQQQPQRLQQQPPPDPKKLDSPKRQEVILKPITANSPRNYKGFQTRKAAAASASATTAAAAPPLPAPPAATAPTEAIAATPATAPVQIVGSIPAKTADIVVPIAVKAAPQKKTMNTGGGRVSAPHFSNRALQEKLAAVAAKKEKEKNQKQMLMETLSRKLEESASAEPREDQQREEQKKAAPKRPASSGASSPGEEEALLDFDPETQTMTRKRSKRLESLVEQPKTLSEVMASYTPSAPSSPVPPPAPSTPQPKEKEQSSNTPSVFLRESQRRRVERLLAKREQKKKKLSQKSSRYQGFVSRRESQEAAEAKAAAAAAAAAKKKSSKYRGAEVINGVQKVLKPSGEVVETPVARAPSPKPVAPPPPPSPQQAVDKKKKSVPLLQEEKDLLDELFALAEEAESASTSRQPRRSANPAPSNFGDAAPTFEDLF